MYNPSPPILRHGPPLPSSQQFQRSSLPPGDPLWQRVKLQEHLASLLQNVALLKSIGNELEGIRLLQARPDVHKDESEERKTSTDESATTDRTSNLGFASGPVAARKELVLKAVEESCKVCPESVSFTIQAAKQLQDIVKVQLKPLQEVVDGTAGPEKAAAVANLLSRRRKLLRNRRWRSRKRRRVAEALQKERDRYEEADREADEWRAKEIAKSIAKRKMEKMKVLAKKKAKEEKARRQEEMDMVTLVEKLHELRVLRIAKLKKQGLFFPEEDDQLMERVKAVVAEEERQAASAANTNAAATAILNAEEARKAATGLASSSKVEGTEEPWRLSINVPSSGMPDTENILDSSSNRSANAGKVGDSLAQNRPNKQRNGLLEGYEGLSAAFQHYYLGSNFNMGTLIEVRQGWDAFIMPGGRCSMGFIPCKAKAQEKMQANSAVKGLGEVFPVTRPGACEEFSSSAPEHEAVNRQLKSSGRYCLGQHVKGGELFPSRPPVLKDIQQTEIAKTFLEEDVANTPAGRL